MSRAGALLVGVERFRVGFDGIVGSRLHHVLALVPAGDEAAQALLNHYLTLSARALQADASPLVREAAGHAGRRLYDWAQASLQGPARLAFQQEVMQRWKPIYYAAEVLRTPMPRLAELAEAVEQTAIDRTEAALVQALTERSGDMIEVGATASVAYQRMAALVAPGAGGWGDLAALCHRQRDKIVREARVLREGYRDAAALPAGSAARRALERELTRSHSGVRWQLRGMLGEIFLRHWPAWQRMCADRLADANLLAHRIGHGLEAEHFAGRLRIDGLEAWDEAILLLDEARQLAALHTGVQMKVERIVSAFKQLIADRARETGRRIGPPTIELLRDGRWVRYASLPLPPDTEVYRYVFFAGGATVRQAHLRQLALTQIRAHAFELDLSLAAFDALALEVMWAVERLAAR